MLGYNQVFFPPEVLNFLPIYFPHFQSLYVHLEDRKAGWRKLMFMSFEIVSICVWLWYFFQKHFVQQLIHIYINSTYEGFMSLMPGAILCLLFYPA